MECVPVAPSADTTKRHFRAVMSIWIMWIQILVDVVSFAMSAQHIGVVRTVASVEWNKENRCSTQKPNTHLAKCADSSHLYSNVHSHVSVASRSCTSCAIRIGYRATVLCIIHFVSIFVLFVLLLLAAWYVCARASVCIVSILSHPIGLRFGWMWWCFLMPFRWCDACVCVSFVVSA